jgi:hypothetical protein
MPAVIPVILAATAVAGKVAEGRAKGRAAETQLNTQRDQITAQNYQAQLDAAAKARQQELSERQFALKAPSTKLSQLLRGGILQGATDAKINVPGLQRTEMTGGLRPSMLSDEAKSGGGAMVQQALQSLLKGEQFNPMTMPTAPGLTPTPQSGGLDTFLNVLGGVGSAAGAGYGAYANKPRSPLTFEPAGGG